jgi:hypothetical protein
MMKEQASMASSIPRMNTKTLGLVREKENREEERKEYRQRVTRERERESTRDT